MFKFKKIIRFIMVCVLCILSVGFSVYANDTDSRVIKIGEIYEFTNISKENVGIPDLRFSSSDGGVRWDYVIYDKENRVIASGINSGYTSTKLNPCGTVIMTAKSFPISSNKTQEITWDSSQVSLQILNESPLITKKVKIGEKCGFVNISNKEVLIPGLKIYDNAMWDYIIYDINSNIIKQGFDKEYINTKLKTGESVEITLKSIDPKSNRTENEIYWLSDELSLLTDEKISENSDLISENLKSEDKKVIDKPNQTPETPTSDSVINKDGYNIFQMTQGQTYEFTNIGEYQANIVFDDAQSHLVSYKMQWRDNSYSYLYHNVHPTVNGNDPIELRAGAVLTITSNSVEPLTVRAEDSITFKGVDGSVIHNHKMKLGEVYDFKNIGNTTNYLTTSHIDSGNYSIKITSENGKSTIYNSNVQAQPIQIEVKAGDTARIELISSDKGSLEIAGEKGFISAQLIKGSIVKDYEIEYKIDSDEFTVNSVVKKIDGDRGTKATIVNGSTFIPIGSFVEEIGGSVVWEKSTQTVTIISMGKRIDLIIGSNTATITDLVTNQKSTQSLNVPAQIINGRTMVPLRFVSQTLGGEVKWNQEDRSLTIKIEQ